MSKRIKFLSLAQMVIRRCQNQNRGGPSSLKTTQFTKLMNKLKKCGYNKEQRVEILVAALKGYKRCENAERKSVWLINRFVWMGARTRRLKDVVQGQ